MASPIVWDEVPRRLAADPAATLRLDRAGWEALGASFANVDDGQGETPGLATATVETPAGTVQVGVLDYGESSTYLLVPGVEPERFARTAGVLELLESIGAVRLDSDLLDLADATPPPTLDQRLQALERELAELRSSAAVRESGASSKTTGQSPPPDNLATVNSGAVKWFSDDKGLGFIQPEQKIERSVFADSLKVHGDGRGRGVTGKVKWFSDEKGFGFITPDDGGKDLFVHHSGLGSGFVRLTEGTHVEFAVDSSEGDDKQGAD